MKKQYHINLPLNFFEGQFPDWKSKTPPEQAELRKKFLHEVQEELQKGKSIMSLGKITITSLNNTTHRIRVVRSAGVAFKY